jgi:hypothetical protein
MGAPGYGAYGGVPMPNPYGQGMPPYGMQGTYFPSSAPAWPGFLHSTSLSYHAAPGQYGGPPGMTYGPPGAEGSAGDGSGSAPPPWQKQ